MKSCVKSGKATNIVIMHEQESEFGQTIAFLELGTQEIEDEVKNSLEEVTIYTSHFIHSIFINVCINYWFEYIQ